MEVLTTVTNITKLNKLMTDQSPTQIIRTYVFFTVTVRICNLFIVSWLMIEKIFISKTNFCFRVDNFLSLLGCFVDDAHLDLLSFVGGGA